MRTTRRRFLGHVGAMTGATLCGLARSGPAWAQPRAPLRDVVVVLPGIMGSVLRKDQRDLWGLSGGAVLNGLLSLGGSVKSLALTGDSPEADDLGDGITADRIFPDTHLIPGFWKIDGYTRLSKTITENFDARPRENFFEFPYDWRRDNRVAARHLAQRSRAWLAAWRERSGNPDAKLVLLAHSMGGLVARHFLEVLGGWRDTRMLVTFGTPYRGSLSALDSLANGIRKSIGPLTLLDLSALVRSFTSSYQLLPKYPCYDTGDGIPLRIGETSGIPNVDAKRAAAALAFHKEIEDAVVANARASEYVTGRYTLHPIVGTYQPTLQYARRKDGKVVISEMYPGETFEGDGTVPQVSATPSEPKELADRHKTVYVAEVHGSLQNASVILDHLRMLLQAGSIHDDRFRDPGLRSVAVIIDDLYATTESVHVRARCDDPKAALHCEIFDAATNKKITEKALRTHPEGPRADLGRFAQGTYRVRVAGGSGVGSATDVFAVVRA